MTEGISARLSCLVCDAVFCHDPTEEYHTSSISTMIESAVVGVTA
jgi:hypothetical protein